MLNINIWEIFVIASVVIPVLLLVGLVVLIRNRGLSIKIGPSRKSIEEKSESVSAWER